MPYNPSCGGRGPCLNNLQEQKGSTITACAVADIRYLQYLVLPPGQKTVYRKAGLRVSYLSTKLVSVVSMNTESGNCI